MTRKLVNLCLTLTLVAGCAGGVLASVCPHAGCETAAAAPERTDAHCEPAPAETHHADGAREHSSHAETHHGQVAESPAEERTRPESKHSRVAVSSSHDASCAHCTGRREAPPASKFEWQTNSAKRPEKESPPQQAVGYLVPPSRGFARQITPAQHAPPGRADRHLLLSVFRI